MKKRGKLAYIREILFDYPELKNKENLNNSEQQRIKTVEKVLEKIKRMKNADEMLKIIDLVYFKRQFNLFEVIPEIAICDRSVYKLNAQIMALMAHELHLI